MQGLETDVKSVNEREFFLANRSLSGWTVAGSILLTNISTIQFIGLNGSAYQWGAIFIAWEIIAVIGMIVSAKVFLPHYYSSGVSTIPEFVGLRYGKVGRSVIAVLVFVSTGFIYLPTLVYSSSVIFSNFLDFGFFNALSPTHKLLVIAMFLVLIGNTYIFFGGMRFIAMTDSIVAIIFGSFGVALLVGCIVRLSGLEPGGFLESFNQADRSK